MMTVASIVNRIGTAVTRVAHLPPGPSYDNFEYQDPNKLLGY